MGHLIATKEHKERKRRIFFFVLFVFLCGKTIRNE